MSGQIWIMSDQVLKCMDIVSGQSYNLIGSTGFSKNMDEATTNTNLSAPPPSVVPSFGSTLLNAVREFFLGVHSSQHVATVLIIVNIKRKAQHSC